MEYLRLNNIKELDKIDKKKKIYFLSGGTDFMIMYKENMIEKDARIIDISNLNLNYIKEDKNKIRIGAATLFSDIVENKIIDKYVKTLKLAASTIGSPQIRNRGTIGGNIGNASPAGDSIPALMVHNSIIVTNEGKYPIENFFKGVKKSILKNGELIKEIVIPIDNKKRNMFYFKSGPRNALAISKASLAVNILMEKGIIKDVNLAAGAVGITVIKCKKCEEFLKGKKLEKNIIEKATEIIKSDISPITDFRSTKFYREKVVSQFLNEALLSLL